MKELWSIYCVSKFKEQKILYAVRTYIFMMKIINSNRACCRNVTSYCMLWIYALCPWSVSYMFHEWNTHVCVCVFDSPIAVALKINLINSIFACSSTNNRTENFKTFLQRFEQICLNLSRCTYELRVCVCVRVCLCIGLTFWMLCVCDVRHIT